MRPCAVLPDYGSPQPVNLVIVAIKARAVHCIAIGGNRGHACCYGGGAGTGRMMMRLRHRLLLAPESELLVTCAGS
jgi:hypothetical protein